ncbi:MAG TPA: hypothetical protein PLN21_02500 [Gemmatales bacterium]|nr:hypothetical protein [Gemmatales bacterium]
MSQTSVSSEQTSVDNQLAQAFAAGRRAGLAIAALAVSLVAFLSLLGAEKALLAIALGILARHGAKPGSAGRRLATAAIGIGTVFLITITFVLIVFWKQLVDLVHHLMQLS